MIVLKSPRAWLKLLGAGTLLAIIYLVYLGTLLEAVMDLGREQARRG